MKRFPHHRGQLCDKYAGGGCDGDEGKVVGKGWSDGCGGDHPRTASSTSSDLSGLELLMMMECTHKRRAIQLIIKRAMNTRTKMVEASATKARGALVVYILTKMFEWGCGKK
jgi:hypothetical protein